MSNMLIALLVAAGSGTWIYSKQMRRSGTNSKNSLILAGLTAVVAFVIVWTIALTIDSAIK